MIDSMFESISAIGRKEGRLTTLIELREWFDAMIVEAEIMKSVRYLIPEIASIEDIPGLKKAIQEIDLKMNYERMS